MSDTGLNGVIPSVSHTVGNSEGIGRKVHGLPIWGWALIIVGGGLLLYHLYTKYTGGGSAASANGIGLAADGGTGSDISGGGGGSSGSTGTATSTNQAYLAQAVSEYGNGANTPLSVQQALSDLFNGNPLTQAEQKIVNQVEGGLGAPPEGTPSPVFAAPPAPSIVGYVKAQGSSMIYQLDSNNVLHWIPTGALYNQVDPSKHYTTVPNLNSFTIGSPLTPASK